MLGVKTFGNQMLRVNTFGNQMLRVKTFGNQMLRVNTFGNQMLRVKTFGIQMFGVMTDSNVWSDQVRCALPIPVNHVTQYNLSHRLSCRWLNRQLH